VNTYPEMNSKIVGLLELDGSPMTTYAAFRIRELEAELADRYRRHAADVEERDRKIAELRKDIKRLETNNSNLAR